MLILAVDVSSPRGSLALCREGLVLGQREWACDGRGRQQLFSELEALLRDAEVGVPGIDLFVVGRGPGNFSGLRASLAAFQALALPGNKPVRAVSSGRALAASVFGREASPVGVRIAGDARRGMMWHAVFHRPEGLAAVSPAEWELSTAEDLCRLDDGLPVCSSEPERLLALQPLLAARLLRDPLYPDARQLALLTVAEIALGVPAEPFVPLYMQPAVMAASK